jgi:predicted RNA-binding Zn ribbon-like protein
MDTHRFELVAGALCLDFVNTVGDRAGTGRYVRNYLQRYEDVVSWGQQAQVLPGAEAAALRALAQRRPVEAAAAHERAVNLRETLHTIFAPIAPIANGARGSHGGHGGPTMKRDALAALNAMLPRLLVRSRLETATEGLVYHWTFDSGDDPFDRIIWTVAQSAIDLLTSGDLGHVHQCALETCGWLFLDVSKNKTRRWCAMKLCGNKSKVRQHRAMRKEGASSGSGS